MRPLVTKDQLEAAKHVLEDEIGKACAGNWLDELKQELSFLMLQGPNYNNRGLLLYGQPGNGKSFIMDAFAKALSKHTNFSIHHIQGADLLGDSRESTEANVEQLIVGDSSEPFRIICIDEIDNAVISDQNDDDFQPKHVVEKLKALLDGTREMKKNNFFIVATSNSHDDIPEPLIRSGRIGKHLEIMEPNHTQIIALINVLSQQQNININNELCNRVSSMALQKMMTVANIKSMVDAAINSAQLRQLTDALTEDSSNNSLNTSVIDLRFDDFYQALERKNELTNHYIVAMRDFNSPNSKPFFHDLSFVKEPISNALSIVRGISDGNNNSGILIVQGGPGSGKSMFGSELLRLASPNLFTTTATPLQKMLVPSHLLSTENEYCGRFDGFFLSNHNRRKDELDNNLHVRYCLNDAQTNHINSIVLVDDGDSLMRPLDVPAAQGHRGEISALNPANPLYFMEVWQQFLNNSEHRNILMVICTTQDPHKLMNTSGLQGMLLATVRLPSLINQQDMATIIKHYNLSKNDSDIVLDTFSQWKLNIRNFVDYLDKTVKNGVLDQLRLKELVALNQHHHFNPMYA